MPKKPSLPTMIFRHLWKRMQAGQRWFVIDDTNLTFASTAYQVSKAIRRFNEPNHKLLWPDFRFTAKILDAYTVEIIAERLPEPEIPAEPFHL